MMRSPNVGQNQFNARRTHQNALAFTFAYFPCGEKDFIEVHMILMP